MPHRSIADITEAIIDYRGKTPPKSANGIKLLTAKVIKGGAIDEARLEYISEETYSWWMRRGYPRCWDILLTTEAPLGEVAILRTSEPVALAQRVILLRGDPRIVDQRYLFAALRSPLMQDRLKQRATGTTVLGIKQSELRKVEVPLPPLSNQRKIAAIISAYDDLIENNNRRITILQEMARRIYREWFIDFRYPGHESAADIHSRAPIPGGWNSSPIGDVIETIGGGTPSRGEQKYWDGGTVTWYTPSDLTTAKSVFMFSSKSEITPLGLSRSAARLFPAGSVMMTSRATIGVVAIAASEACTNQGFITCLPNERLSSYHIYFWLHEMRHEIDLLASGATFKEISRSEFRGLRIAVPPLDLERSFSELVHPFFGLIRNLEIAVAQARKTREILLPRLVSGEIDVEDLDINIEDPAA
jgi:type I restriction enzyme S subunit